MTYLLLFPEREAHSFCRPVSPPFGGSAPYLNLLCVDDYLSEEENEPP